MFMFQNVIKEAFDVEDSSSEDDEDSKFMTSAERMEQCLQIYEEKNPFKVGRVFGPSQRRLNKLDCVD